MQLEMPANSRLQPSVWPMLIIGCSQTSGSTIAEATKILLRNSRGPTRNLVGLNHTFK